MKRRAEFMVVMALCWSVVSSAFAQNAAPPAPLRHYRFVELFPTKFSDKPGDAFRATAIAVDAKGNLYLSARDEGVVVLDSHRRYRFSLGVATIEQGLTPLDSTGHPVPDRDLALSRAPALNSPEGGSFGLDANGKTYSVRRFLFDTRCMAAEADGTVYAADSLTGWLLIFGPRDFKTSFPVPVQDDFFKFPGMATLSGKGGRRIYLSDVRGAQILVLNEEGKLLKFFGKTGEGKLKSPGPIAFGPDGTLYVADTANTRIAAFDSEGNYLFSFGKQGEKLGEFTAILGIAVDKKAGRVFVSEGQRVQAFDLDGVPLGVIIGEDPHSPRPLESRSYDEQGNVISSNGKPPSTPVFNPANLWGGDIMAVDSRGYLYIVDNDKIKIYRP